MNQDLWQDDMEYFMQGDWLDWNRLRNRTVLVTGAAGLIGSGLIRGLAYANENMGLGIRILALVRDISRAVALFGEMPGGTVTLVQGDVERMPDIQEKVHFIVHGASPTASAYFVGHPVETIKTAVNGTINMLELGRKKEAEGFVYLSSMEIYGVPETEKPLSEADVDYMNPLVIRNCYPESKRLCEALCAAYAAEYGIHAVSVRLAQTIGPGVSADDKRIFAEFARCVLQEMDIVILTDGSSKRCYLYTMDAARAILTVLLKGKAGRAYNAGNPDSYCSVLEMAEMVAHVFGKDRIHVKFAENEDTRQFPPPHYYNLDMGEIFRLGFRPSVGLPEMYKRMIEGMVQHKETTKISGNQAKTGTEEENAAYKT